ncbi:MAG: FAD-dependent oxidoreductase [Rhodocyclaceae bacterium]|nr:FAD-dependent oxidoreductase [Rhodocyclaceae bacterium]
MNKSKLTLLIAIAGAIGAYFALDLGQYLSLDSLKARQAELEAFTSTDPLRAGMLFFVTYVVVTGFSIPGAAVLTLVAGAVFGLMWGTLLVSFASTIGASLAFLAARFLLRDAVQSRFGNRLATINRGIEKDGSFYLFTLRLVPAFPFFMINLVMGLTPIPLRTFFWVSQLGMLAGTIVYVNAGTQLAEIDSATGILSPSLLASFAVLGVFPLAARKLIELLSARKVYKGWQRPAAFDCNLVVIGAGSAGLVSAYLAAAVKARVTLIERHRMGGDCLNTGCVPSKALIRAARLASQCRHAEEFGVMVREPIVDFEAVMARVQRVVKAIEPHDSVERYRSLGVDVVEGSARLLSPWEVEITRSDGSVGRISSRALVIATGASPFVPPIPGLADIDYLTSDNLWALRSLPRRLLVLGGGPIGCELAQAFSRLGSQVTLVEMAPQLMGREDADVAELAARRFIEEGIDVRVGHQAVRFEADGDERVLVASREDAEVRFAFDRVLVAVGRAARLDGFGLDTLGIESGTTILTNEFLQTRYPNIYAAGDVAGPYQFTHVAAHQAWYAAVNALFDPLRKFRADYSVVPWATFIDPEIARVGLNETEARNRGIAHEVTRYDIGDLDRAIADGAADGFVKVLTVPGKDRILGVTIVGRNAGELIAEYVLAMKHHLGLNQILGTIHVYPTMAEANKYAAGSWKRAHAPETLLRWVARFHQWRRGKVAA